jgi:hypothetical protein
MFPPDPRRIAPVVPSRVYAAPCVYRVCTYEPILSLNSLYLYFNQTNNTAFYSSLNSNHKVYSYVKLPTFSSQGSYGDHIYSVYVEGGIHWPLTHLHTHTRQSGPRPRMKHVLTRTTDRAPAAHCRCRDYSHATRLRPDAVRLSVHYPLAQLALMHQTQ